MAFPWYCGYCSKWQPSQFLLCPTCGRSSQGRLCRKCKNKVPGHALFCPKCGGDNFIEPAGKKSPITRGQRIAVGVTASAAIIWSLVELPRIVMWLVGKAFSFGVYLAVHVLIFLLLTAWLPGTLRQRARGGAWWLVKTAFRAIGNLFQ